MSLEIEITDHRCRSILQKISGFNYSDIIKSNESLIKVIFISLVLIISTSPLWAANKNFIDINVYGDTRGFATITPSIKLDLQYNLSYLSFVNLDFHGDGQVYRYYTKQNLYLQIAQSPLYLAQQFVSRGGKDNDLLRYGPKVIISDLPKIKELFKNSISTMNSVHTLYRSIIQMVLIWALSISI